MPFVDVLFGNEEDFSAALGFELQNVDAHFQTLPTAAFRAMIARAWWPRSRTSRRSRRRCAPSRSASVNGWGAICWHEGQFYEVAQRDVEILDRVGGGDSFASGFIYGLLAGKDPQWALECGVAHGALAMSTPGDTTMATFAEVMRAMKGSGTRIDR